jgi:hypothetical protein
MTLVKSLHKVKKLMKVGEFERERMTSYSKSQEDYEKRKRERKIKSKKDLKKERESEKRGGIEGEYSIYFSTSITFLARAGRMGLHCH